jgi:hypothetical protein
VQFSGAGLEIGESVPPQNPDAFAEEQGLWPLDFVSVSASFPSEILEIEVVTDAGTNKK